ncbi:hypothetical protein N9340_00800 [Gammaproteobacteria bacterium]|nr:hypothetical protein [Gammaproteobacteria bacterium]
MIIFFFSSINLEASVAANCTFSSSDFLEELSKLKNIQKIEIAIKKHKKWTKNLMKATLNTGPILPEYKKRFDAKIKTYYQFGSCIHEGRVRLHGDWKDHIDFIEGGKFIQSLDVSLTNGSIANFVKFKLLLPETRKGGNEIILTHLLRYLGFVAPRTSLVDVAVNGISSTMIIQEKDEKELLEGMNLKEGPLFEGDETFLFSNFRDFKHLELIDISLSKMTNKQWAQSSNEAANISLKAFSMLQKAYLNYVTTLPENNFYLDWNLLAGMKKEIISKWAHFEILLFAAQASHALIPHNRKFYFDVFNFSFEPIYWDGEPRSLKGKWMRIKPNFKYYEFLEESHFEEVISMISLVDQEKFISSISEDNLIDINDVQEIFSDLSSKVQILKNEFLLEKTLTKNAKQFNNQEGLIRGFRNKLASHLPESKILNIKENDQMGFITSECDLNIDLCTQKEISFLELGEILETKSLNKDDSKTAVLVLPQLEFHNSQYQEKSFLKDSIKIQSSNDVTIFFDNELKNLNIELNSQDSWVLIYESNLANINVNFTASFLREDDESNNIGRINSRGLSGCISFFKANFDKSVISAKNLSHECEDTVNIINSLGNISELMIDGSYSDGLDIDFSDISIDLLKVKNAKNDCVDLSKGSYILGKVFLSNCGDKAISIGEQSVFSANLVSINHSNIGIASKDSSISKISKSDIKNSEICVDAYQKKQEFFGSVILIDQLNCNSFSIRNDKNSKVYLNEL